MDADCPLFDAIAYMCLAKEKRPELIVDRDMDPNTYKSQNELGKLLFCAYFTYRYY